MRLSYISIIFIVVLIPVMVVYSLLMDAKIRAVELEIEYNKMLSTATADAIRALEQNTSVYYINPDYLDTSSGEEIVDWSKSGNSNFFQNYSTVADSLKVSTEAMINTFLTSISTSFGTSYIAHKDIKANLPAMLITMYNGYYIYSPDALNPSAPLEHTLKPFTFYSEKYESNTIVVNYSLDNFVSVIGTLPEITNLNNNNKAYHTYSGYIVDLNTFRISGSNVQFKDSTGSWVTMTDSVAKTYYTNAINFTKWFASLNLRTQKYSPGTSMYTGTTVSMTVFAEEKREVIRESIITSLEIAITNYNNDTSITNYTFKMPRLSETDWDKILSNIGITAFLQGMPIGTRYYNNYSIATSSESRTVFYLDKTNIFFTVNDDPTGLTQIYHRIDCTKLDEAITNGYPIREAHAAKYYWETFELKSTTSTTQSLLDPFAGVEGRSIRRLFPVHAVRDASGNELYQKYSACYYCITNKNYTPSMTSVKEKAYYEAVAKILSENDVHSKRLNFKP